MAGPGSMRRNPAGVEKEIGAQRGKILRGGKLERRARTVRGPEEMRAKRPEMRVRAAGATAGRNCRELPPPPG